jgi:Flp pilus assembly protein TadG
MIVHRLSQGLRRLATALRRELPRRLRRDERGAAAVEFALVAMPFFLLLGAIIETALLFLADQILETATTDAARLIRTGQATDKTTTGKVYSHDDFTKAVCDRLFVLFDCSKVATDVRTYTSFSGASYALPVDSDGNYDPTKLSYSAGVSSGIVVVRVYYQYPLFFNSLGLGLDTLGNGKHLLAAVTAFRNEPYPW